MASSSITITIVQAVHLSFPARSRRQCIVEIVTGDTRRHTESVKSSKDKFSRWDSKLHFPVLDKSSKLIVTILHDKLLWSPADKCLGKIDIKLEDLLKLQYSQPNDDVVLSWSIGRDLQARSSYFFEYQKIQRPQLQAMRWSKLKRQQSSPSLSSPRRLTLLPLLPTSCPMNKIGDEVAKIHPYVNFAWQVLSAGLKVS
ncbi:hypothetical protein AX14_013486 [Amanita brunnescens Koide BX004]|nr:hypothetical protein AX14_013486 [Amanita brunnescens Koide BX004]